MKEAGRHGAGEGDAESRTADAQVRGPVEDPAQHDVAGHGNQVQEGVLSGPRVARGRQRRSGRGVHIGLVGGLPRRRRRGHQDRARESLGPGDGLGRRVGRHEGHVIVPLQKLRVECVRRSDQPLPRIQGGAVDRDLEIGRRAAEDGGRQRSHGAQLHGQDPVGNGHRGLGLAPEQVAAGGGIEYLQHEAVRAAEGVVERVGETALEVDQGRHGLRPSRRRSQPEKKKR